MEWLIGVLCKFEYLFRVSWQDEQRTLGFLVVLDTIKALKSSPAMVKTK